MPTPKKKPNRRPNLTCRICGTPFYGSPSVKRVTCSMPCRTEYYRELGILLTGGRKGASNSRWKGGRWKNDQGYMLVLCRDHPRADRHGYVREHRLVMEKHLRRFLTSDEVVHHVNHQRDDNRLENLKLYPSNGEHKHTEGWREVAPSELG